MRKKLTLSLIALVLGLLVGYLVYREVHLWQNVEACGPYLPEYLSLDTEFCEGYIASDKRTTIRQKLARLGAYCRDGRIYDRDGREIRFYAMRSGITGKGHSPEKQQRLDEEVAEHNAKAILLKRHYTVVEMWSTKLPN
jgi:hypothetical protein